MLKLVWFGRTMGVDILRKWSLSLRLELWSFNSWCKNFSRNFLSWEHRHRDNDLGQLGNIWTFLSGTAVSTGFAVWSNGNMEGVFVQLLVTDTIYFKSFSEVKVNRAFDNCCAISIPIYWNIWTDGYLSAKPISYTFQCVHKGKLLFGCDSCILKQRCVEKKTSVNATHNI